MVYLNLDFKTYLNLLIFFLFYTVNGLWIYRSLEKKNKFSLIPFISISVALLVIWARSVGIDMDESEHLHCSWMISQGLTPFKDFWQHHSPLLWLILAPFLKIFEPSVWIFEISRLFCAFIFMMITVVGWQIAKKVWREKAKFTLYLLILFSCSIWGEFLWIRPDLFMMLLLLAALYFSLDIPGPRVFPVFLTGILYALAVSFIFKQFFLFFLPVIVVFLERNKLLRLYKLLLYLAGLIIGILPLLLYLIRKNILSDFFFWVFDFNRERVIVSAVFPVAVGLLGVWGARMLFKAYRESGDTKALILFLVFYLSVLSSLNGVVSFSGGYYMGFWFILCSILGCGCDIMELAKKFSTPAKKSLVLGLFLTLLIYPNIVKVQSHRKTYFTQDKKIISRLIEYCGRDTCLSFIPYHPIFNYDATRLYSSWQSIFIDKHLQVKKDAKMKNITQAVLDSRPAVISYSFQGRVILFDLFLKELISKDDFDRLRGFLKENYTVRPIGGVKYYIRNDKLYAHKIN